MARGRRARQRQLTKAVNPNFQAMAEVSRETGSEARVRPFALMEAIQAATGELYGPGHFEAMPRDPQNDSAFGPMDPLRPEPIDSLNDVGRTDPRAWQYQVGWNLPGNGNREVPWQVLRGAATGVGVIRRCIEVRKKHARDLRWVFGVSEDAIQDAYLANPGAGKLDAEQKLRERLMPEINRLREFWRKPWKSNDADMGQWVNAILEDYLTLDAVVIFPRRTYGGDVHDLEIIDAATIKPLLDHRGVRPLPPHPAFQQVLYGFPRGEWTASAEYDEDGNALVSNAYASSELFYRRENFRSFSPYGFSAVEMALFDARLYLARQKWMLAEYDDGSTPLTWIETAERKDGQTMTLSQQRAWEKAYNDKVRGQTAERHRIKVMPNGWKAMQMTTVDERYKPEYDLHLIKLLCSYFGVTIAELGFTEPTGLGNNSWHEGQAEVTGRLGLRPDTVVLTDVVNAVSRQFLRMPPELEFSFVDPSATNDVESDQVMNSQRTRGTITINEERQALGQSLLPFPEANMHFLTTPTGPIFLEGAHERAQQAADAAQMQAHAQALGTAGKLSIEEKRLEDGQAARAEQRDFAREQMQAAQETGQGADVRKLAEISAYRNWSRKHREPEPARPFLFKHVTPDDGFPELEGIGPWRVQYEGWEWWVEDDLTKSAMSWLEWNLKHPNRPRDASGRWVKASTLVEAITDQAKKDAKRGGKPRIEPAQGMNLTAQERRAMAGLDPSLPASHRQAKVSVARNRASMLSEMEEIVLINQGSSDLASHRFEEMVRRLDMADDPHVPRMRAALANGEPEDLHDALVAIEQESGLERIGGDRWLGPDQLVTFDRKLHDVQFGTPQPGQRVFLTRPGYHGTVAGERVRLSKGKIVEATPEEIRQVDQLTGGGAGPKDELPTWESLGRPAGASEVGQKIGHQGGFYERLPGEPRRYRVVNAEGVDISDRISTRAYGSDGWHERNQTAEDARVALNMDALERERVAQAHASGSVAAQEAVPVSWSYRNHELVGLDDEPQRREIKAALGRWSGMGKMPGERSHNLTDDPTRVSEPAVNTALRGAVERTEQIERDIAALDRAFELSRTKRAITVYRGYTNGLHVMPDDWQERDLAGMTFHAPIYSATSGNKEVAADYIGLPENRGFGVKVKLPKGFPALSVQDEPGGMDDEGEIILPRNLTFRVTKDLGKDAEGLRWLEVSASRRKTQGKSITKATAPDEPTPPPVPPEQPAPPDQRWPGWLLDAAIAAAVTALLLKALPDLSIGDLVRRFAEWTKAYRPGDPTPDVRQWLTREQPELTRRLIDIIGPAVRQAHIEGALVGQESSRALIETTLAGLDPREADFYDIDWQGWSPGNVSAAETLLEPGGLERLLYQSNVTIKQIATNELDSIGRVLGEGLARGDSPEAIARTLRERVLNNKAWAQRIAVTETNRAMSYAAVMNYRRAGMAYKGWMTAFDQRVCATCLNNELEPDGTPRIVPIDELFPSGDPWPPAHPHCRCAPIPVIRFPRDIGKSAMSWLEWNLKHPSHPRIGNGRFGRGEWRPGAWHALSVEDARAELATRIQAEGEARDAHFGVTSPAGYHEGIGKGIAGLLYPPGTRIAANGPHQIVAPSGVYPPGTHGADDLPALDPLDYIVSDEMMREAANHFDALMESNPLPKPIVVVFTGENSPVGKASSGIDRISLHGEWTSRPMDNKSGFASWFMPMASDPTISELQYHLVHEYGHVLTYQLEHQGAAHGAREEHKEHLSPYGKTDKMEAYAEAFAEFFLSAGMTENPAALAYAERFGWNPPVLWAEKSARSTMSWLEWNLKHPSHPRIGNGRFGRGTWTPPSEKEIEKAFTFSHGNLHTEKIVIYPDHESGQIKVLGRIVNRDWPGDGWAGFFERWISRDDDGSIYVEHERLAINERIQGQGFAHAFNSHMEKWYRANGVSEIRLQANIDVGGYAWARAGYDWQNQSAVHDIVSRLRDFVQPVLQDDIEPWDPSDVIPAERLEDQRALARQMYERFTNSVFGAEDYPTPYEVAALGRWSGAGRDDTWIGKAILLGSSWDGVKHLD